MKIALDAKKAFNNTAGLGQYSRTLINGLIQRFTKNNYFLFTSKINKRLKNEIANPYTLLIPTTSFSKFIPAYYRTFGIINDLKKEHFSIYHGLSNELPLSIHKVPHLKKIVTIHDVIYLKHKEQYKVLDRKIYHYKTAYAVKHADCVIAISEETKNDLMHFYTVPENKIKVIYQSCNPIFYTETSSKQRQEIKQKYGLPDLFILNVSSFYPRKNHKKIIEAFALIRNQTKANLLLVGDQGKEKKIIIKLIKDLNLVDRIQLLSKVTNEEMPALYQQAALFLYPSLFEGFGIPILEALNSKLPVITTKGGCFEEVGGATSIYVDPKNEHQIAAAIVSVLTNKTLSANMIVKGLEHAETMKEEKFIAQTMAVYESVLS